MSSVPSGFPADHGRSYQQIERLAQQVRGIVAPQKDLTEPVPGVELFEALNRYHLMIDGRAVGLDYGIENMRAGVEAQTRYEGSRDRIVVLLSPDVYEGLDSGSERDRFTLCHEVGHAVQHSSELVRWAAMPHEQAAALLRGPTPRHAMFYDTEWQVNAFASAMLMPAAGLAALEQRYGALTPHRVRQHFQVSGRAAEIRLDTFHRRRFQLVP